MLDQLTNEDVFKIHNYVLTIHKKSCSNFEERMYLVNAVGHITKTKYSVSVSANSDTVCDFTIFMRKQNTVGFRIYMVSHSFSLSVQKVKSILCTST